MGGRRAFRQRKLPLARWYVTDMTRPNFSSAPPLARRTVFALWLDVALLALFLLLETPQLSGVWAHEVIGLALVVPLVMHLLLSWHWIVAKAARLGAGASFRARFNYAVNVTLFVAMVIEIVSGAVVSRAALPALGIATIYDGAWYETHDAWSNVLMVTVALHLAMNWGWVDAVVRRHAFSAEEAEVNEEDAAEAAP